MGRTWIHGVSRSYAIALIVSLVLAACGGETSGEDAPAPIASASTAEAADTSAPIGAAGGSGELRTGLATLLLATGLELTADVLCQLDPAAVGEPEKWFEVTSVGSPAFELVVFQESLPTAEARWVGDLEWRGDANVAATKAGTLISGNGSFTADGEGNDHVAAIFNVDCDV